MPRRSPFFRYRRPSLSEIFGVSQAKRRVSRKIGLATLRDPNTPLRNAERRVKNQLGYYSEPMKAARKSGCLKRSSSLFIILTLVITLLFSFFSLHLNHRTSIPIY